MNHFMYKIQAEAPPGPFTRVGSDDLRGKPLWYFLAPPSFGKGQPVACMHIETT